MKPAGIVSSRKERPAPRTRAIFEACTVGGRSAAEVAREFGVSPGFVRIVRHRGLAKERKATKKVQRFYAECVYADVVICEAVARPGMALQLPLVKERD